jgi:hypothetical protein
MAKRSVVMPAALAALLIAAWMPWARSLPTSNEPGQGPTYDLLAPSGAYSILDGQESNAGAIASVDLAGTWGFTPKGEPAATIQVPGGGWTKQGYPDVAEATYVRRITVPDTGHPQVTKIEFGSVNHQATLYVDGVAVGTQTTSITPQAFDITPYVQLGHSYDITVDVKGRQALLAPDGKTLVPDIWEKELAQGIFRSAFLRVYPEVYLSDVAIRPSVANHELSYTTWVTNATSSDQDVRLDGNLTPWNAGENWHYPLIKATTVDVPARSTRAVTLTVPWTLGADSWWWPNVPYHRGYQAQLHMLNVTLTAHGVKDAGSYRFGFRDSTQRGSHFYLNGVQVNYRGDNLGDLSYFMAAFGHPERGDVDDTYPGFLPPTTGNPGWPKAVDNYGRLNLNVIRISPTTPYMLDVADEMGLMLLAATQIGGECNCESWVSGHDHAVNHARDTAILDRNHASVVRWESTNEPANATEDSERFEQDVYQAMMDADPTRPIEIDGVIPSQYPNMRYSNFTGIPHYVHAGQQFHEHGYTDDVIPLPDHPYGQGEYLNDVYRKQAFSWWGTSVPAMRLKDAADVRPFAMEVAWVGIIPGVRLTDVTGLHLYGADNLPDPWSNPIIQLIQRGFNPLLVEDTDYWNMAKLTDQNGNWPAPGEVPTLVYGSTSTRSLQVFNDTFSDPNVLVSWKTTIDSPTGAVVQQGQTRMVVPLGGHVPLQLHLTAPQAGSRLYLTLTSSQPGNKNAFSDSREYFDLSDTPKPTYVTSILDDLPLDQDYPVYVGDWGHSVFVDAFALWDSWDRATGDTATVKFTGKRVKFYGVVDSNRGIAGLSLDGGPEIPIDEYSPTYQGDVLLWTSPTLPEGEHTVTVRVTGQKNPNSSDTYVYIDRFDLLELYKEGFLTRG